MFEYFCEEVKDFNPDDLQRYLNGKARLGWRLHSIIRTSHSHHYGNSYDIILEKAPPQVEITGTPIDFEQIKIT